MERSIQGRVVVFEATYKERFNFVRLSYWFQTESHHPATRQSQDEVMYLFLCEARWDPISTCFVQYFMSRHIGGLLHRSSGCGKVSLVYHWELFQVIWTDLK